MTGIKRTINAAWTCAVVAGLAAGAFAQPSIRVEDSRTTGVRRSEGRPIDIRISSRQHTSVTLTPANESRPAPAPDSSQGIDLAPNAFSGSHRAPAAATPPPAAATPVTDAPSGIPVPTDNPVPAEDKAAAVEPPPPTLDGPEPEAPSAAGTTATAEVVTPTAQPVVLASESSEFLPSADLGMESFLMRNGQKIPLRPELLSSATLAITVPDVYETTLTNGIHFYHYENHDLPRVRVALLIEAGKNADPADKVGLAELTARTIRAGGAGGKSGDEIDRQLEQIGSDLDFNVDLDNVSGGMFALTGKAGKADEAMALLADVLMKPDFDEKKLDQQRSRALEELRRQNDQPDDISRREFRKIIYGPDHPLARTPTSASLAAITRDDVRAFHDARYRPSTLWVGVSGDITQDDARKLVEKAFGTWERPPAEKIPMPTLDEDRDSSAGVYVTQKATAQSQIRLGHLGIARRSPKAYAVNVLNSIYGTGGFSSRLMNSVRTKNGYVYGVGGGIFSDDPEGLFAAVAASKSKTTVAAIKDILQVTQGLIDGPISEDELETARRDIVFTFINQFDTPAENIATHMLYDYRGYDADYLKTFPERVRAVTADDVKNVANELLQPGRIKIYVIGNQEEMDAPLSTFGNVQEWKAADYTGE